MTNKTASKPAAVATKKPADELSLRVFALLFGLLLGLSLLKFGNPIVLEKLIDHPTNGWGWVFNPWPAVVGYWLLAAVTVVGCLGARWRNDLPRLILALPLIWLAWQFVAGTQTVDARLTNGALIHFSTCVVCFYLGVFALGRSRKLGLFWLG